MTTVVAAVIRREQKILVCQRSTAGTHPLKWEFPGGKVEPGESLPEALRRELHEELGIHAEIGPEIGRHRHAFQLVFYEVTGFTGAIENRVFAKIEWTRPTDLTSYDFLDGDLAFVRMLTAAARKTEHPGPDSTVS